MKDETIPVRITENDQIIEVVVLSKRPERIQVVLGKGVNNVTCDLTPTRTGAAYAGKVMGREIVYERSREQVRQDIERLNPTLKRPRARR